MTDVFTAHTEIYDRSRKKLIPCFDTFYATPASVLKMYNINPKNCMDLGAGTGLLSAIIAQDFDIERLVLLDQSEAMLDLAIKALSNLPSVSAVTSSIQNINENQLSEGFEVIWSALAIHHLNALEKQKLFKDIYSYLKPGGIFINADQSLGRTAQIEKIYRSQWLNEVREKGVEESDLSKALERMKEDRMDTLEDQLQWLENAGFSQVNAWFQDYSFNVYSGMKV